MKKILIVLMLFCTLTISLILIKGKIDKNIFPSYKTKNIRINTFPLKLYLADIDTKREQGLSNIKSMPQDEGVMFIFNHSGSYSFWMKDMNFALDFIYLEKNKIVDLKENISPSTYPNTFVSNVPADTIIEVNSGIIKKYQIKKGMEIRSN